MVTVTVRALVDKKSTSQPNSLNLSSEKCDGAQYKQAIRSATDCHGSTDSNGGPRQRDNASPERNTQLALAGTGMPALPLSQPVTVAPSKSPCDFKLERHGDRDNLNHDNHPSPSRPAAGQVPAPALLLRPGTRRPPESWHYYY